MHHEKKTIKGIARFENELHFQNNTENVAFYLMFITVRDFYDSVFGDGRYEEKFDLHPPNENKSAPWLIG